MIGAVIDIGTNSVRLLIAKRDGAWGDIVRELRVTRLGQGVDSTRRIADEAMERTLGALAEYRTLIEERGAERVRVVATSAMRDAENAAEFIRLVKDALGLEIEVISGEEEGRLTFAGATGPGAAVPQDTVALVVDVGGGSTEFIWGAGGRVHGAVSLDIGSVRLTELFLRHDPPQPEELAAARRFVHEHTDALFARIADENPAVLIAVAGTATQLAAVHFGVEPYDPQRIHGARIGIGELEELIDRLAALSVTERKKLVGMHPQRADVIVGGAIILEETLAELCFPEMVVSERDLLDGLLYSLEG